MTGKTHVYVTPFVISLAALAIISLGGQQEGTPTPKIIEDTVNATPTATCQIAGGNRYPLLDRDFEEEGIASWYGQDFHGRQTSCGEIYDMHGLTAAHKTLPMHTLLLVRNLENDREVTVRVNDRGPFYDGRIIDLTKAAAESLGFLDLGTAKVRITTLAEAGTYRIRSRATGVSKPSRISSMAKSMCISAHLPMRTTPSSYWQNDGYVVPDGDHNVCLG